MVIKAVNGFSFLNFTRQIKVKDIAPDIIKQLPAGEKFITSADEEGDTLQITEEDGVTKFVIKFVDGKKVSRTDIYNGKESGTVYFDENGNQTKIDKPEDIKE